MPSLLGDVDDGAVLRSGAMTYRFALALVLAAFGCDSKAKASDPGGREERKPSKEYESCGTSSHCDGDLRCFDHVCKRTSRSPVGDYYAALGEVQTSRAPADAITSFATALDQYKTEKIALPADIDCGYGAALARDPSNREHAELGARVLHRCILAVPVGSSLRDRALTALAGLQAAGLNPLALGGTGLADRYMTGPAAAPPPPPSSALGVTVTATPPAAGKSIQAVIDKLGDPDVKAALVACATTYIANTKKDTLATTVGVKVSYLPSQYDDEQGAFAITIEPPTALPAGTPEASADTCVHSVVDPAIKAVTGVHDAGTTKLAIAVK